MKDLEQKIIELGHNKTYTKDEFLVHADDPAEGFYYLQSGEIRVFKMDEQGKEVEVVRPNPGDFFGEAIVFVQKRFPSYAQAVKDSQVVFFDKNSFFQRLEKDPTIGMFFLHLLAKKCIVLNKRIETLELRTVRQRLIQYLVSSCGSDTSCVVTLPMKKAELAKLLGTISETLSRNLKQLQEEGLITVKGHTIHIKDRSRLTQELGDIS
ncbi:MAG: Crp/Fnr family transcriptional regulator [Candidatus Aminicenantaceae bacterium]